MTKMGMRRRAGGLALAMGLMAALPALGQDAVSETALPPEARGVGQAVTAAELAAWGRSHQDPGALIMAARLLAEVPVRQGEGEAAILTPDRLLDEAVSYANGRQGVLDAIESLRQPGSRGVASSPFGQGPIFMVREVQARETYWFDVEARGGEVLRVAAIGDGDTNIDMAVRDARGVVVCQDGFGDHYPVCTIAPREPGRMRVDIINRGDVWTKVQILSN